MTRRIRIERFPYEEPHHVELVVNVAEGDQASSIHYYTNASDLKELGQAFSSFPLGGAKEHMYEIGSENPEVSFAYYIRIRLHLISANGESGIEIRFNNNREPPERCISEFTLRAEVAGINRLGALLSEFGELKSKVLVWNGSDGELDPVEEFKGMQG